MLVSGGALCPQKQFVKDFVLLGQVCVSDDFAEI